MLADGLETQTEPFPKLDEERHQLMAERRDLPPGELSAKCVYYLARRKWCDLPELALPVEPHWWCRLWRL